MNRRQLLATFTALAALAPRGISANAGSGGRGNIYQRIWDADQAHRGLPAIGPDDPGDAEKGFVRVDIGAANGSASKIMTEVKIPEAKRRTYDLVQAVFDNYRLDVTQREQTTLAEAQEVIDLLKAVFESEPMEVARLHAAMVSGRSLSRDDWQEAIFDIWFRSFDDGSGVDLSGFEHVVVGERRKDAVQGNRFWYRYYLEDLGLSGRPDAIEFDGLRYPNDLRQSVQDLREAAFISYRWRAVDLDDGNERLLSEPSGGFWIGCSVEGLMALGMARFFDDKAGEAAINRARYAIALSKSPDQRSLRSFSPRLLGFV